MVPIPDDLINKCRADPNNRNWNVISSFDLSEFFIREFQDKLNWNNMSCYQTFSESFIKEFQDKVQWKNISYHQQLSEPFIEEFINKINWKWISRQQVLSKSFINKFYNKIDLCAYLCNEQVIPSIIYKYRLILYPKARNKNDRKIINKVLARYDNQRRTKIILRKTIPLECACIIASYL